MYGFALLVVQDFITQERDQQKAAQSAVSTGSAVSFSLVSHLPFSAVFNFNQINERKEGDESNFPPTHLRRCVENDFKVQLIEPLNTIFECFTYSAVNHISKLINRSY